MKRRSFHRLLAPLVSAWLMGGAAAQAQTTEISFFYPVAVGGPIARFIDGFAADFDEGQSRHQGDADLRGHLPGDHRQGADRAQVRPAAGHLGAAVDRHVHADRRGRDPADRRLREDGGGPGPGSRASTRPS
jgi:hypothetical protein